jgi:hypothetical protein
MNGTGTNGRRHVGTRAVVRGGITPFGERDPRRGRGPWLWPEGVQPLGMNGTGAMAVIMLGREVALPPFGDERDRDYGRRLEMAPYVQLDLGGVIDAGGQESQGDAVAEDR